MGQYVARGHFMTVDDVVKHNTGMTLRDLDAHKEYQVRCLKRNSAGTYDLNGLSVVADVLRDAAEKKIPVTIMGDYDTDGITASAILAFSLNTIGIKPKVRLPRRMSEGFGLSMKVVDEIREGILITVDNGIAAIEAVKKAKEKDLCVIITDHHLPNKDESMLDVEDSKDETGYVDIKSCVLPEADYIVNPHLAATSDFPDYCGAGIAYKLALELVTDKALIKKLTGFAAIGTVGDVMPLLYDNRQIVKEGLENLVDKMSRTSGMEALLRLTNKDRVLTSTDIGFNVSPMINAPGRMSDDGAMTSLVAISYNGPFEKAEGLAQNLININASRKQAKDEGLAKMDSNIATNCLYGDSPLCIYDPTVSEGIIGIIAGRMAEEKKVPCFIFTDTDAARVIKGSGRTYGSVDLKDMLDYCQDLLVKYGGHREAAGISIERDKFEDMKARMKDYISKRPPERIDDNVYYDLEIDADDIEKYIEQQKKFEPFGQGNPKPVFYIRKFEVLKKRTLGSNDEHIKCVGKNAEAIGFGISEQYTQIGEPRYLDIIGTLSENFFNGAITPQVEILEMQATQADIAKTERTCQLEQAINRKLEERRAAS